MKKLFVMLFALASVGSASAGYKIEMKNDTDHAMRVEISYLGRGTLGNIDICSPDDITLQAGEYKSIDVGICCTASCKVTDLRTEYYVPLNQLSNHCGGFAFTIKKNERGQLLFWQGASK